MYNDDPIDRLDSAVKEVKEICDNFLMETKTLTGELRKELSTHIGKIVAGVSSMHQTFNVENSAVRVIIDEQDQQIKSLRSEIEEIKKIIHKENK
jgi:hypothetical protein